MENRLESIQSQIKNEEDDLKSRIENRLKWLRVRDSDIKRIHNFVLKSEQDPAYVRKKDWLYRMDEYLYCTMPLTEIYYHYLEIYHPSLYRSQLIEVGKKHGKQATIQNAFDCLKNQPHSRRSLILSISDNGIALNHCVSNDDYDSFCQKIQESRMGSYEVLCICDFLIEGDTIFQIVFDQIICMMNTANKISETQTNFMISNSEKDRQLVTIIKDYKEEMERLEKLDNYLRIKYVQTSRNVTDYEDHITDSIDIILQNEYTVDSLLDNLSDSLHDLFSAMHFDAMVDQFYTEFGIVANLSHRYLECLYKKGYSIEKEVIYHCEASGCSLLDAIVNQSSNPKIKLLIDAKDYLEKKKETEKNQSEKTSPAPSTKGRPKSSWLNFETKYTEEEIGRKLRDEIWQSLIDRISEFELLDPRTQKKIEGEKRDTIINALGCCFIFNSAYSLGYTDGFKESNILSSFVRTTNVIVKVSRNTIKKYWWVIKEAEEWGNRQSGYKKAYYASDKKMLTLMLERNLKAIEDTKDFVKIKLDVFWRNLES